MRLRAAFVCLVLCIGLTGTLYPADEPDGSITNLYDAFGKSIPGTKFDWGYSALIRFQGKTILFDAGANADQFAANVQALGVDLRKVDFAVLSHRHGDHASGFDHAFRANPSLRLYAPDDLMLGGGPGLPLPPVAPGIVNALPDELKYFPGMDKTNSGTWGSRFWRSQVEWVKESKEISPGVFVIATTSPLMGDFSRVHPGDAPALRGFPELSLALVTSRGIVVVTGCSHSGVAAIARKSKETTAKEIELVVGGFHLLPESEAEIVMLARTMKDEIGVRRVAPAHCTGMMGFKVFRDVYGKDFVPAGLGTQVRYVP
jgi:7,8-dihydropterin-6-yl-methyl-4-(beta-D-ribofuranosyl)aminobenzene 5'-phosphate synthase